jgi:hypothetical protein
VEEGERRRKELDSVRHQLTAASSKIADLKGKIDF